MAEFTTITHASIAEDAVASMNIDFAHPGMVLDAYQLQGAPILLTQLDCIPLEVHLNLMGVAFTLYRFDSGSQQDGKL